MNSNPYRANGYNDREDYLSCIAEDYGVDLETVKALAACWFASWKLPKSATIGSKQRSPVSNGRAFQRG